MILFRECSNARICEGKIFKLAILDKNIAANNWTETETEIFVLPNWIFKLIMMSSMRLFSAIGYSFT